MYVITKTAQWATCSSKLKLIKHKLQYCQLVTALIHLIIHISVWMHHLENGRWWWDQCSVSALDQLKPLDYDMTQQLVGPLALIFLIWQGHETNQQHNPSSDFPQQACAQVCACSKSRYHEDNLLSSWYENISFNKIQYLIS